MQLKPSSAFRARPWFPVSTAGSKPSNVNAGRRQWIGAPRCFASGQGGYCTCSFTFRRISSSTVATRSQDSRSPSYTFALPVV